MTRINRVQRLVSLRSTAFSPAASTRTLFLNTRSLSSTPCRRADEPPVRDEAAHIEPLEPLEPVAPRERRGLRVPPKTTIADTEAEIAAADPTYTPATSMADLEPLPLVKTWWRQPGNWGPENEFSGFGVAAKEKITDPNLVKVMLRRAVLEVQALQKTGEYEAMKFKRWAVGGKGDMARALKAEVQAGDLEWMAASLKAEDPTVDGNGLVAPTLKEAQKAVKSWDSDWMARELTDELKFVIRKRLFQLTGTLLPDAKLAAANTVSDLATLASVAPKPKKLYQVLSAEAKTLPPNIKIHGRRVTPIDKEKSIGRWKVIEKELRKRDLPVTGFGDLASHKEKVWLTGKK